MAKNLAQDYYGVFFARWDHSSAPQAAPAAAFAAPKKQGSGRLWTTATIEDFIKEHFRAIEAEVAAAIEKAAPVDRLKGVFEAPKQRLIFPQELSQGRQRVRYFLENSDVSRADAKKYQEFLKKTAG